MKLDQLIDIFTKQIGARKEAAAYIVPTDHEATLYVAFPAETIAVARVTRLEVAEPFVLIDTSRGERFVLSAEDIRAVKIDRGEVARRERSAGFGK